ncbi:zinc ribbon domain-containing protein [Jiangella mangrovi]|uniref:Putative nucleic acid-binding Zn-ribbon protein n=1 Tax=Jiangella mangrovi TaxID=1524084 RepID=A0A7W9LPU3_9ACTN|nr:nucleic acid-binding protein [Jiangella mangrovi]MBB5791609.1 putative nucleic acid-binding Zn-ribbon protein [Jiangella mangrovi]
MRLLDVQAVDQRLDQLAHRRKTLPEAAELETLAAEHSRLRDAEVVAGTAVADLEREQKRADSEVEQVRARKDRDQKRLDAGQVSSAKELESLQSEIASLNRRQGVLEDAEIEIMERLEEAQNEAAALAADRDSVAKKAQEVQAARDSAWSQIDQDAAGSRTERESLVAGIPADLLALYEKIRADRGGIGAAALRQRRCEGCMIQLDAAELGRIRGLAPEVVVRHEECRRILVRTPESGL